MDIFKEIVIWVLVLSGAAAWLFALLIVIFYWLCQRPPQDEE